MAASGMVLGSLDLNAVEASGVQWVHGDLKGWGSPASTLAPVQKPRQAGAWGGLAYSKARPLVVVGTCIAPTADLASDALDRLEAADSLDSTILTVSESGRQRWVTVRRDGEVLPTWYGATAFAYSIQLVATDPRKYGTTLTASTNLPSTAGGLTIPYTIPYQITSTQVSGQVSLTNPGNMTGPVTLRIDGPCVGPSITHVGPGGLAQTVALAGYSMGSGEFLTVDMEARTVLAQGQASRSNFLTARQWFGFEPGVNTFAFSATSYNPGALLTVSASPTWG